jgi:hypothetical protein
MRLISFSGPKSVKGEEGEKYDNYLTKLQNICTENVGEESKSVTEHVKGGLSLPVLPTPT